jgi:hypothetical protein
MPAAAMVLASLLPLAGCATNPEASAAALPANWRQLVADRIRTTFFDPWSIRDAGIAEPVPGTSIYGHIMTVCVRANAKNRLGAYTGLEFTGFVFRDGQIAAQDQQNIAPLCAGAAYGPFPELAAAIQTKPN